MRVYVNGEARELGEEATLEELLRVVAAPAAGVAVEVNRRIVRRKDFPATRLAADDRVEIVTLVGGG